ncbi:uncharacterized protein K489DRAFT_382594 [Dissoconium aciculare CBS 342.82]|uniref:Uncharacterized protein n=1 Tax=Dissoconium aciculare CBS 342.82 TaxID=1314786 RepID=A0A6J3LY33_9PEZI|nr:uncharacterized protein K489DRAFT_382594 [Dissoconium aciculare CBS 342.82]KAF1820661.1 hypothetical protein K489DRAFT_382594 [Dissoconium aciculare CBS 342.82]
MSHADILPRLSIAIGNFPSVLSDAQRREMLLPTQVASYAKHRSQGIQVQHALVLSFVVLVLVYGTNDNDSVAHTDSDRQTLTQ